MKRAWMTVVAVALVAGCNNMSGDPGAAKDPKAADPKGASAAVDKKVPQGSDYFEARKNGKTYVLGSVDSLKSFGQDVLPAKTQTFTDIDPLGDPVVIEATDDATLARLKKEYQGQHKK